MKDRKYKPGRCLRTPMQVVRAYERRQWLYLRDRVMHPAWVHNMTLGTVMMFLRRGMIRIANEKVEAPK